jgi:erythromycin esterase-like protein
MRVRPALPGSWEQLLRGAELPRCYLTAAAVRRVAGERAERLERAVGVVYRPDREERTHYLRARLADQFDGLIHVDTTRGIEPIDLFAPPQAAAADLEAQETHDSLSRGEPWQPPAVDDRR